jgi:gamma-glutamylcyclotransferase (GGCT)/AIG2-like uncharacterized protein YtfP
VSLKAVAAVALTGTKELKVGRFLYFAYGSNMLLERLAARCPSARRAGTAYASAVRLTFWKSSKDGSGKAMLTASDSSSIVYGALFELDEAELEELHRHEGAGAGYDYKKAYPVFRDGGEQTSAAVYNAAASHIDQALVPYDWYLALVIAGAKQSGLPSDYVENIRSTASRRDGEMRKTRRDAEDLLERLKLSKALLLKDLQVPTT